MAFRLKLRSGLSSIQGIAIASISAEAQRKTDRILMLIERLDQRIPGEVTNKNGIVHQQQRVVSAFEQPQQIGAKVLFLHELDLWMLLHHLLIKRLLKRSRSRVEDPQP